MQGLRSALQASPIQLYEHSMTKKLVKRVKEFVVVILVTFE